MVAAEDAAALLQGGSLVTLESGVAAGTLLHEYTSIFPAGKVPPDSIETGIPAAGAPAAALEPPAAAITVAALGYYCKALLRLF
jgi:hypothetical protein